MSENTLFDTGSDELLKSVYARQGRTLDDLPYTPQFEAVYAAMGGDESGFTRHQLFHRLHNLRKAGQLPRMGRAVESPPRIDAQNEQLLTRLVEDRVERLSLRDRLPYTDAFDQIVISFNTQAGLSLSPHDVWRIIAKLAK